MGRWLRKVGKFADKIADKVESELQEKLEKTDMGQVISKLTTTGRQCVILSRETIQICEDTNQKRQQMIEFGSEIQETLSKMGDASVLNTIRELTSGEKIAAAMELARGLDDAAMACVNKSIQMIDLMDSGMDSLPDFLQNAIEHHADKQENDDNGDGVDDDEAIIGKEVLRGIDRDVEDVKTCIQSLQSLNLATAMKVGLQTFSSLTEKAKRSQEVFDTIRRFATDVQDITDAFHDMKPRAVVSITRDMLRCIRLSDSMKEIAAGAGRLIKMIIDLFKATAERISTLWKALAYAKDCMDDCLEYIVKAKKLCLETKEKSITLITKSRSIQEHLQQIGQINKKSIQAVRSLSKDGEIQSAFDLAMNMDDFILECAKTIVMMINRVDEGFRNIPTILTEDINVEAAGSGLESVPEPANVENDIGDLEDAKRAIESANIIEAAREGVRGFSGVSEKSSVCKEMLELVENFAGNCDTTIASFLSVWDLDSATRKITEMCQLANLGKIMKQFADQIQRLVQAIIQVLKASIEKFSWGITDFADDVGDIMDSVKYNMGEKIGNVGDKLSSAVDNMRDEMKEKLNFFK